MNSTKTISAGRHLRAALLGCALLGALAGVASAQPASPVGNWDLLISGAEQGVGFLTFNSDSTVGGWEIVTFRPNNQPTEFTFGRQGIETNGGNTAEFFFFGYTPVTGNWSIATSGQLVGFIAESDGTNVVGSQFSFHGHTRAGKSLVLNTVESPGPIPLDHSPRHTTWSGAPLTNVVDLTGSWLAQGSVSIMDTNGTSSASFSELLTLTSLPKASGIPSFFTDIAASPFAANAYLISGTGPGYTNFGLALQSSKKRLAVVLREGDFTSDNTILRAFEGPLYTNKFTATGGGTDDNVSNVHYRLQLLPPPD